MTMVFEVAIVGHMICLAKARAVHAAQREDLLVLLGIVYYKTSIVFALG